MNRAAWHYGAVEKLLRIFLYHARRTSFASQGAGKMHQSSVHNCQCPHCLQPADPPDKAWHRHMNLFLSRLNEQQRRWYVALESNRIGHGGDRLLSTITGMN